MGKKWQPVVTVTVLNMDHGRIELRKGSEKKRALNYTVLVELLGDDESHAAGVRLASGCIMGN